MKLAVCTNFVSPYRRPVFRALAEQEGFKVRVFTSVGMEKDRGWEAGGPGGGVEVSRSAGVSVRRAAVTRGSGAFEQTLERHIPVGLPIDLLRFRPDAIISGELGPRTALARAAGALLGAPVVPWTYHARYQQSFVDRSAGWRRRLLSTSPAVIGMGSQAREILRGFGCADAKIFDAMNAADVDTVGRRLGSAEHARRVAETRNRWPGKRIAVVVGRLVEMKGIEPLLAAWAAVDPSVRENWKLVFVGDGPLLERVENHASIGAETVGHVSPETIPDWFASADLHLFASLGDPWGLVVNEAMQCGTPTLCSVRAGCADELIRDGETGLLFDPAGETAGVAAALADAMTERNLGRISRAGRRHVAPFTPRAMALGMAAAVRSAVSGAPVHRAKENAA